MSSGLVQPRNRVIVNPGREWWVKEVTSLSNKVKWNSGHSSFFTKASSPESVDRLSSSTTSGGTSMEGRSKATPENIGMSLYGWRKLSGT